MGSVREIAKKAGVSATTVSRALNNHPRVAAGVRAKILKVANRTRYVPTVARRSTTNIAFAYTGASSLGSPFDAALMQGMSERMEEFGFDLMIVDLGRGKLAHETYSQMFVRKGIRGAVLRTTARTRRVCEAIGEEGFPCVVVGDRFENGKVSYIYSDSRDSSREAVEHLIALGHERIAMASNVVDDSDHADRVAGYREALQAAGIEGDSRLILRVPATLEGGTQLIRRMSSLPGGRPTAVYVADPLSAVGAMNEAMRGGLRIPEDLSVVGFDDGETRFLTHPRMTAVCQNTGEIGREAFAALHEMIGKAGSFEPLRERLPTRLEIHESTGRVGISDKSSPP